MFAKAGSRAGKVPDVAARVGVTEPAIFQNFGSKAALFAAVLERAAVTNATGHARPPVTHDAADSQRSAGHK